MGSTDASLFNTDFYTSPFILDVTAVSPAQFTTEGNTNAGDWLVRSDVPGLGNFKPVPQPSSYGLAGVFSRAGGLRRSRQSKIAGCC